MVVHMCPQFQKVCDIAACHWWRRMAKQKEEALSETNRYYFRQTEGREPVDDNELIVYYALNGGARDFYVKEHQGEEDSHGQQNQQAQTA